MQAKGTILVVDDEPSILSALNDTLEDEYVVLKATNGVEALAVLDKSIPDLIISDISMPNMDGMQLLENVKRRGLGVKIPFLFLSAKGQVADVEKGLTKGAYAYIVKPFLPTRLLEKVEEIFTKLQTRKDMKKKT